MWYENISYEMIRLKNMSKESNVKIELVTKKKIIIIKKDPSVFGVML